MHSKLYTIQSILFRILFDSKTFHSIINVFIAISSELILVRIRNQSIGAVKNHVWIFEMCDSNTFIKTASKAIISKTD